MNRVALAVLLVLTFMPALAQQRGQPARPAAPAAQPAPAPETPPPAAAFEPQLLKLSETLGALAFLTDLCRDESRTGAPLAPGESWRQRMQDLLEAEAQTAAQQERLAGAFNRGFSGYATTYRSCTSSGRAAIERLLQDGQKLAKEISNRFGT